jgi:hypothetical protein
MHTASGREIIADVVGNMRRQVEELRYSRVVASSYNVHLHPDDYARLEGLLPELVSQTRQALDEELERLNRPLPGEEKVRDLIRKPRIPYRRAGDAWSIRVLPDPNDELQPGHILVDATLAMTGSEGYAGNATQRVVTHRQGEKVEGRVEPGDAPAHGAERATPGDRGASDAGRAPDPAFPGGTSAPGPARAAGDGGPAPRADAPSEEAATERSVPPGTRVFATLRWRDDRGEHRFAMIGPTLKIGRGGQGFWVDVQLETLPDVSREHVQVRRDEATGSFFVQDLSRYGTSVNGVRLPARAEGAAAGGAETPLALPARLDLAGAITLEITAGPTP